MCTGKSFPSEPGSSEAQAKWVSSAIQFFQSCAEIVCDTWKHLHGWCVHSLLMITALIRAPICDQQLNVQISNVICLTTRNQLCSFIFVFSSYTTVNVYKLVPIWIRDGASLVLRHSVRYTHTVLRSGNKIGWSLHRGSQTSLSQCPWEIGLRQYNERL